MIKQHCFNCGAVFDLGEYKVEHVDGFPVHVCPKCGDDDYPTEVKAPRSKSDASYDIDELERIK